MAKSLTQEMASEIARIAQTRVVEEDRVRFHGNKIYYRHVPNLVNSYRVRFGQFYRVRYGL